MSTSLTCRTMTSSPQNCYFGGTLVVLETTKGGRNEHGTATSQGQKPMVSISYPLPFVKGRHGGEGEMQPQPLIVVDPSRSTTVESNRHASLRAQRELA